jgi:ATP-dependent DNA ligase
MLRLYQPCIPTRSKAVPSGPQWVHEIKHDGYRIIVRRARHALSDRTVQDVAQDQEPEEPGNASGW